MSRTVATVHVGTPPPELNSWETADVWFHGFKELPSAKDQGVLSPKFTCLGHQWCLSIYPGGVEDSKEGMVALFLCNMSKNEIEAEFGFSVKDENWQHDDGCGAYSYPPHKFPPYDPSVLENKGDKDFSKREVVLKSLVEGALIIEVSMIMPAPSQKSSAPFIPENPACTFLRKMFMDEKSSDIVFEVSREEGGSNARKKAKISPVTFYAHRLILTKCAPQLAELCVSGEENISPVLIPDITPEIFRFLLYYVYGGEMDEVDLKSHAKEIIDAADKYGIWTLKLEAEVSYVNTTKITMKNMMNLLLYSDAKNCALLKEAVMDFIVENKVDVLEKISFNDAPAGPTMITDILAAVARGDKSGSDKRNNDQLSTMRVSDLRRKAHEKGLDVDGSRDALIAALKGQP